MLKYLEFLGWVSVIAIALSIAITVLWFVCALVANFWKIYCKKKPVNEQCDHPSSSYTENHPDRVWTCNDCGKNHFISN